MRDARDQFSRETALGFIILGIMALALALVASWYGKPPTPPRYLPENHRRPS